METSLEMLKKLAAWDSVPLLTEIELTELLERSGRPDDAGLAPDDPLWTPTYDVNAAAAAAWLIKAGRAASTTETEPDSIQVTSKIFDNCRAMARLYSSRLQSAVRIPTGSN